MQRTAITALVAICLAGLLGCQSSQYAKWKNGPPVDENFFPIMVWAQNPDLAPQYKDMGINTYFSLYNGPTEEQLATLKEHGMYAICAQNEVGLAHVDDPTIIAWMHGDEPDNRKQYYDDMSVPLEKILKDYNQIKKNDPSRPIVVNFGQGTTNEKFAGRGISYELYPKYAKGADIVSYDFYPIANYKDTEPNEQGGRRTIRRTDGEEYLWMVPRGVDRLQKWTDYKKPVWNILECTAISHPQGYKVSPHQLRAQVWMSLIHGSTGIGWFVHQFEPNEKDVQAILSDEVLKKAVSDVNHEILSLAPVLNSKTLENKVVVESTNEKVPIDIMVKKYDKVLYVFAVGMRNQPTGGQFTGWGLTKKTQVQVIGEQRTIPIVDGMFTDQFGAYDVRLYRIE